MAGDAHKRSPSHDLFHLYRSLWHALYWEQHPVPARRPYILDLEPSPKRRGRGNTVRDDIKAVIQELYPDNGLPNRRRLRKEIAKRYFEINGEEMKQDSWGRAYEAEIMRRSRS
jgi:hypothetical protein